VPGFVGLHQYKQERERLSKEFGAMVTGTTASLQLPGRVSLAMQWCPPGTFTMGSPEGELGRFDHETQCEVTLSRGFWMARTELTQAQWMAMMDRKPTILRRASDWVLEKLKLAKKKTAVDPNPSNLKGADLPVETVSWDDAKEFVRQVNESGMLPEGWKMALPTEAQWEYACRAGTKTALNNGKDLTIEYGSCPNLDEVGWYGGNSGSKTHAVGGKKPNAWGLHDMHGNVWEWCEEWYDGPLVGGTDPTGPVAGVYRVLRGGSWIDSAAECRAAYRYGDVPFYRSNVLGFRPALVPSE
jgi:formylglycine-generating enzyme required for sulfatase activity